MKIKSEKPKSSESQTLDMARQALSRIKELDLTDEQRETVRVMIDQAQAEEKAGQSATALKVYNQLLSYLKNIKFESENTFEDKAVDYIDKLFQQGAHPEYVGRGLSGLDSEKAWEIRDTLFEKFKDDKSSLVCGVAQGLAGLDSEKAWEMREILLSKYGPSYSVYVLVGLAGLDSERAWEMRDSYRASFVALACSLAGLDSERAWKIRDDFLKLEGKIPKEAVGKSLAGLDSERAWQMRENLLAEDIGMADFIRGLIGVDSDRAWEIREDFFARDKNKQEIAESLAGLDSEKAWDMRARLLNQGVKKEKIAESLAGLDSDKAWKMRAAFLSQGVEKGEIILGVYGDYLMAGVRKARKDREKNSK